MIHFPKRAEIADSETLKINSDVIRLRSEGKDIIPLVAGEPDYNTPDSIKKKAIEAIDQNFTRYTPTSGILELRQKIVTKLKAENGLDYDPAEIVVSCGAKQAIANVLMALTETGDKVLIPSPYWVSYKAMAEIAGAEAVIVPTEMESGFKLTVKDLEKAWSPACKILIFNSPSNPTGMVYSKNEMTEIADFCVGKKLVIISDEIYEKLIYDGMEHVSIASLGKEVFDRTVVINGFSKSCAMTGWRVGYSAALPKITDVIKKLQVNTTSHTSSISQYAALAAFDLPASYFAANVKTFQERRDYIASRLDAIPGLRYLRPNGAFYFFIRTDALYGKKNKGAVISNDIDLYTALLNDALVAVVPGSAFGDGRFIRISYSYSMESLKKAFDRISTFVGGLS